MVSVSISWTFPGIYSSLGLPETSVGCYQLVFLAKLNKSFSPLFFLPSPYFPITQVILMEEHGYHISLEIINLAVANKIELICLPAHSSLFLQPLDVGVVKTVKNDWARYLRVISWNPHFQTSIKRTIVKCFRI